MKQGKDKPLLRRGGFTFKQFFVGHDRCGMKVTTDGVILGTWTNVGSCQRILDIGTGTGLLALMLAQRSESQAMIDAVEIDLAACQQAQENVQASPWHQRIRVFHQDIADYAEIADNGYDLIISNPPYFPEGTDCRDESRAKARYTHILSHQNLLMYVDKLLAPQGRFSVMLPCASGEQLEKQALDMGWFVARRTWVCDVPDKAPYIVLLELSKIPLICDEQKLVTHQPGRKDYTEAFKQLAKDFYLAL
ncbi:methyltransferase [Budviciaceae bacterium BWR-B9]|uniref:tRNA1(Val) (adenine(37)-N6)-methyltransferase n=1 Tax=Limnobaculum allomyrinae TaxID=2791986 RepID=A0ABS1INY9_9GAMM|nr:MULTISPECIES: methyltransferase [Limnobaculum]MBK5143456.1 methyltransferase [Limnobaculum allomyrinae]MBV7691344.1 methyltransferase [Limnobaculum sp. M2-1]